jgi:protein-L-isoaspartate(D-aspartate) O-methyltransferase
VSAPPALKAMVREHLRRRGIGSLHVLGAFLRVDRRHFVPADRLGDAYGDYPLPIGCGQTVSQPFMVALMLEALGVRRGMKVLEVGAGSGYAMALLKAMGARPYGVEFHRELALGIAMRVRAAGLGEVAVRCGDGGVGWPEEAPFDRILISAACPRIPDPLLEQLGEGGLLVAPVDSPFHGAQVLTRMTRRGAEVKTEALDGCVFVPLLGAYGREGVRVV